LETPHALSGFTAGIIAEIGTWTEKEAGGIETGMATGITSCHCTAIKNRQQKALCLVHDAFHIFIDKTLKKI
jgi:hypothetical protein